MSRDATGASCFELDEDGTLIIADCSIRLTLWLQILTTHVPIRNSALSLLGMSLHAIFGQSRLQMQRQEQATVGGKEPSTHCLSARLGFEYCREVKRGANETQYKSHGLPQALV